jgi:hypothetical protein
MACNGQRDTQTRAIRAITIVSAIIAESCSATDYNVGDGLDFATSGGKTSAPGLAVAGQTQLQQLGGSAGQLTTPISGGVSEGGTLSTVGAGGTLAVAGRSGFGGNTSQGGTFPTNGTSGAGGRQANSAGQSAGDVAGSLGASAGSEPGVAGTAPIDFGGSSATGGVSGIAAGGSFGGAPLSTGGASAVAGMGACDIPPNPSGTPAQHRMLLRDAGVSRLAYVDVSDATKSWVVPLEREVQTGSPGRDMQLVGNCRVLVGTDAGYEEYDVRSGSKVAELTAFPGTFSAQRLRNRNTLLVGVGTEAAPYQSNIGIVLVEVSSSGVVVNKVNYPGTYVRLVRPTASGTFLVANNTRVFEGDASGTVFSTSFVPPAGALQIWKALRVTASVFDASETIVSTGYGATLAIFRADGSVRRTIGGGTASIPSGATAVDPYFFAGFQVLSNGNYVVANYRGTGNGNFSKGIPVLEYTPANALAWYWGDPSYADRLSSIQEVIVVDNLDLRKLHVEDTNGQQVPVE